MVNFLEGACSSSSLMSLEEVMGKNRSFLGFSLLIFPFLFTSSSSFSTSGSSTFLEIIFTAGGFLDGVVSTTFFCCSASLTGGVSASSFSFSVGLTIVGISSATSFSALSFGSSGGSSTTTFLPVSYTHLRAHET